MKREELKALELSDEVIDKIMTIHGADIEKQKDALSALTVERDGLKTRLDEANEKLEGYDPEWKTKAEQAEKSAKEQMEKLQRGYTIREQVSGIKFTSDAAKRAFVSDLENQNLAIQDGKILGLQDFIEKYKENDPGAILSDNPPPQFAAPGQGRPPEKKESEMLNEKYRNNPFFKTKGE